MAGYAWLKSRRLVILSVLAACLLMLLPWPPAWTRPYWVALVMLYWILETGHLRRPVTVFFIGLGTDLLTGALMGQHALSLLIMAYLTCLFRSRLRFFTTWQQTVAVFLLLLNDRVLQLWVLSLSGTLPDWHYWLSPVAGAIAWPWLFLLLDRWRSRGRRRAGAVS